MVGSTARHPDFPGESFVSAAPVAWVFEHSPLKGASLLVHVAIADSVGEGYDYRFWMGQAKLAAKARVTRGSVVKAIDELENLGLITKVKDNQAEGKPNVYRFEMPDVETVWEYRSPLARPTHKDPETHARSADNARNVSAQPLRARRATGSQRDPKEIPKDTRAAPKKATTQQVGEQMPLVAGGDHVQVPDPIDELFADWWDAYPRKIGKKLCKTKWRVVIRDLGGITKAEPVLVHGGNRWLEHWAREKTPPDKIPHPLTWLNRGDYEAVPAASDTRRSAR